MRPGVIIGTGLAIVVAGCGSSDAPPPLDAAPSQATERATPASGIESSGSTRRGRVTGSRGAVVRIGAQRGVAVPAIAFGRAPIEPSAVDPFTDVEVVSLRWTGWGGDRAVGRGIVRVNQCEPSCGRDKPTGTSPGTVTLSRVRPGRCQGERSLFYTRAQMKYPPIEGLPGRATITLLPECAEER